MEAIAAYQLGAEIKLLQKPALDLALAFQAHHKEHADLLAKTVEKLGGKPVAAKAKYAFPVAQLKSQADVLRFAAKLEQGAVSAYLGAVPLFGNRDLSKAAASILGDEAMHWAILRQRWARHRCRSRSSPDEPFSAGASGDAGAGRRRHRDGGGADPSAASRSTVAAWPAMPWPTTGSGRATAASSAGPPAAFPASSIRRR